jgi:hypothetical protein
MRPWFGLALLLAIDSACGQQQYTERRKPCADHNPLNDVYWGDLHVHTRYSLDASTQATRTSPAQAYRFALGEELEIQPWSEDGRGRRALQLERPLDFAAVTDHAELLGEVEICNTPGLEGHDGWACRMYRWLPRVAFYVVNGVAARGGRLGFCGEGGAHCRDQGLRPWLEMQGAAELVYDRSEGCSFTSFVGYEWTGASSNFGNIHRNVIFRNADVPRLPASAIDSAGLAVNLYRQLDEGCIGAEGNCDAMVIPHNSNLSDGYMFKTTREDGSLITAADAATRARFETVVEVFQHKGASECYFGSTTEDELCAFEQLPYDKFSGRFQPWTAEAPTPDDGFLRQVMREGMRQAERIGINPFQAGFIGSTDTHLGAPGAVNERGFPGHGGAGASAADELPAGLPDELEYNPGGLAAVWAPENSRDALFDALRRRETYATSGPRIRLRMFGGKLPEDLCEQRDFAATGYRLGVPMGGELPARSGETPTFAIRAERDPGTTATPGQALQRLQIVKGWVDEEGNDREQVFDVAGDPYNGASVDTRTCATSGPGFDQLCTVWRDSDFDPTRRAYYYARAVENPSCRWSQHVCVQHGVDCANPDTVTDGLEGCCDAAHRPVIQERAVSSPIWIDPWKNP